MVQGWGEFVVKQRGGFTLVEVVIAASVLVIALFGILSMAFHTYKKSDVADEAITASNLASERLAYFRSHINPFKAVGGTFYAPPKARNEIDLNQDRGTNRANLHNIWNATPTLFVREYVYATSESRFKNPTTLQDEGRDSMKARHAQSDPTVVAEAQSRRNFIPPTPMDATIDGIFPNWGNTVAPPAATTVSQSMQLDGTNPQTFTFQPAPRANDALRGAGGVINQLPPSVRYVREVWVQTNHPLGAPFNAGADEVVAALTRTFPAFYTSGAGTTVIDNQIRRGANTGMGAGVASIRIPSWVVTVTVRVFVRDAQVRNILNNAGVGKIRGAGGFEGIGYDPTRPLATAVGYFGVRHTLGN